MCAVSRTNITDTTELEIDQKTAQLSAISVFHSISVDHDEPRHMEPVQDSPLGGHRFRSTVDAQGRITLIGTTRGHAKHDSKRRQQQGREIVRGLREDKPDLAFDNSRRDGDPALLSAEEALKCFEHSLQNATCTLRLHKLLKHQPNALDEYYSRFDTLSPEIKAVLIDAVPLVGDRKVQVWLVDFFSKQHSLGWDVRAINAAHHVLRPERELVEAVLRLSVAQRGISVRHEERTLRHSALLALGSLAGKCPEQSDRVFNYLVRQLELLKMAHGAPDDIETMATVLRALGNQGHDGLLDVTPWFHAHVSTSVR